MRVPTVDVIVPCFNYGGMLADCVTSVLRQEGVSVRVLIMDDASTDNTEAVGTRLAQHARVEYRRHETNRGHIATYNEALALVTADYCLVLSADDMLTPGALGRAACVMQADPSIGLVYGRDIVFRHGSSPKRPRTGTAAPKVFEYREFLTNACRLGHTGIQLPTAVVRSKMHRRVGGYLPELPHSGDTEIWLRMAADSPVAELDADQAYRRLHASNMSLDYTPLARLAEQVRAFDIHFETRQLPAGLSALRAVVHRTIAEAAVWSAGNTFDKGDAGACDAFLAFALATSPDIASWPALRRLQWKRRVGPSAWKMIHPLIAGARRLAPRNDERRPA